MSAACDRMKTNNLKASLTLKTGRFPVVFVVVVR